MIEVSKDRVNRAGGKCAVFHKADGSEVHATISRNQSATNAIEVSNLGPAHGIILTTSGKTHLMNDDVVRIMLCNL